MVELSHGLLYTRWLILFLYTDALSINLGLEYLKYFATCLTISITRASFGLDHHVQKVKSLDSDQDLIWSRIKLGQRLIPLTLFVYVPLEFWG